MKTLTDDFPQPVLAIRSAIAIGLQGGVRHADDSWLTEFWEVGHTARNATEAIHEAIPPFQSMVGDTASGAEGGYSGHAGQQLARASDAMRRSVVLPAPA